MQRIFEMAKKYYPDKWNKAMIDNLLAIGRLTQEEYDAVIGEDIDE